MIGYVRRRCPADAVESIPDLTGSAELSLQEEVFQVSPRKACFQSTQQIRTAYQTDKKAQSGRRVPYSSALKGHQDVHVQPKLNFRSTYIRPT